MGEQNTHLNRQFVSQRRFSCNILNSFFLSFIRIKSSPLKIACVKDVCKTRIYNIFKIGKENNNISKVNMILKTKKKKIV